MTKENIFLAMLRMEHSDKFMELLDHEILRVYEDWLIWHKKLGWVEYEDSSDMRQHFAVWASSSPVQRALAGRDFTV